MYTDYLNQQVPILLQCFFTTVAAPTLVLPRLSNLSGVGCGGLEVHRRYNPAHQSVAAVSTVRRKLRGACRSWLQIRGTTRCKFDFKSEPVTTSASKGTTRFSKATDDSSAGRNAWLGNLGFDNPQVLDNLGVEHGISSNDATNRLTAAIIVDLPFGKDRWIGGDMNRVLDAIVGGWSLNSVVTLC